MFALLNSQARLFPNILDSTGWAAIWGLTLFHAEVKAASRRGFLSGSHILRKANLK
jgi:hypothetical protein